MMFIVGISKIREKNSYEPLCHLRNSVTDENLKKLINFDRYWLGSRQGVSIRRGKRICYTMEYEKTRKRFLSFVKKNFKDNILKIVDEDNIIIFKNPLFNGYGSKIYFNLSADI